MKLFKSIFGGGETVGRYPETLIEEAIERAHAGTATLAQVGEAVRGITTSANEVKQLVDQMSDASQQQRAGVHQVSQAIAQMETTTQGTAATAEESAAASEELAAQAETSAQVIEVWERVKAQEKAASGKAESRLFKQLPPRLPALMFAEEVAKRIAKQNLPAEGIVDSAAISGRAAGLDEATLARYLYCPDTPAADLIIRTAGEQRLSNFLLWRSVGAVFWSTPVLWPDFQREHLVQAIDFYRAQVVRRGD